MPPDYHVGNTGRFRAGGGGLPACPGVDPFNGDAYRRLGKVYEFNNQLDGSTELI